MFDKEHNFINPEKKRRTLGLSVLPKIGYRYQGKAKGFFFRALVVPFLVDVLPRGPHDQSVRKYFDFKWNTFPIPSLGVGYSF